MKPADVIPFDLDFLNVREDYQVDPANRFYVEDYVHGRCHLFALALAKATQYKIGIFVDEDCIPEDGDTPIRVLVHAFCYVKDDLVIDARGIRCKVDLENEFEGMAMEFAELEGEAAEAQLQQWMAEGGCCSLLEGEEKALGAYVRDMRRNGLLAAPRGVAELSPSIG
ncbi:hypothetical protein HNP46_006483 [Pseudomonas nitritireducens]|uniref:Uncharacterized protein n=1 Tax=Pseudomonas nitroreducens TaxID=46680 RepID=A0A7W7KRD9_PSENT|nr:hypothetical protein [Pseudomonas nitritireducens]MBB4867569.1 hypothetical protein [Pseudomonas nitritireducens]